IFFERPRTVASGRPDFKPETLIDLFTRLHRIEDVFAVLDLTFTALVQSVLCVNQFPVFGQEPLYAIEIAGFFVRGERNDQVTIRNIVLLLETYERGDPDRSHRLVVGRAPAPKISISFKKFERVDRPIFSSRLDDVQMSQQQ